ncbi:MAG: ABC transporter permease [Bradymonadia bacterium]|jgi:ABC-2 type transport system permease protein
MTAARALGAIRASWRASLLAAMQYRGNFILVSLFSSLWTFWSLLPLVVVFDHVDTIQGWSAPEATLVMAWFVLMRGLLDAVVQPNLGGLVERVRTGTLDFILLKPADPQVLVSFASVDLGRFVDVPVALGLTVWALDRLGHVPGLFDVAAALLLTVAGVSVLYALWLCAAATAFWWVKVDSLTYLLGAVLDAGRWPSTVYRGWVRVLFTVVFPIAVMTSAPPRALLGKLEPELLAGALALAVVFLVGSRWVWRRAVSTYTSASS